MAVVLVALMYDRALRRERRFRDRLDPLSRSDRELIDLYRFPRLELIQLIQELDPFLKKKTRRSRAIPTQTQLLATLRVLASGSYQHIVGHTSGMAQASMSRTVCSVTSVLSNMAVQQVRMPPTVPDWRRTAQVFQKMTSFPRVIGVIDGRHVAIRAPVEEAVLYVNHKKFHSLNIQVVCNAAGVITSFCVRFPGSFHDSCVWRKSDLRRRFAAGKFEDYLLIGDSSFPLEPFLMTPVANPSTAPEEQYNSAHKRMHAVVEQTLRDLKNRFRCLHKSYGTLKYAPQRCAKIITACILLHNRCIQRGVPPPQQTEMEEEVMEDLELQAAGSETGTLVRQDIIQGWST